VVAVGLGHVCRQNRTLVRLTEVEPDIQLEVGVNQFPIYCINHEAI
jgi:hypothetical protein